MMRRLLSVSFFVMLLLPAMVLAQTSMQGKVTDASTGVTAPGATGYAQQLSTGSSANFYTGIKAGVNLATYSGKLVQGAKFRPTLEVGGFLTYYLTSSFAIQPEANFVMAGAKGDFSLYHYTKNNQSFKMYTYKSVKTVYVQLPILFKYAFSGSSGFRPAIFAGPAIDVNLGHNYKPVGTSLYPEPTVTGEGSSIIAGISAKAGKLMLDARFDYGLTRAFNVMDATNMGIAVTIGYIF
ncbi:MAG TPA: porin family protein [Balneolales bacterium]|nr:porin family protein [Balneolales bacterium]